MTTDPSFEPPEVQELRRLRAAVLGDTTLPADVQSLVRAGINASFDQITRNTEAGPAVLRVDIGHGSRLRADDASVVSAAIQAATATVARGLRDPASAAQLQRGDRDQVPVVQRMQIGSTIVFEVPRITPAVGELASSDLRSSVERALNELVNILPETGSDDSALDAILGQRIHLRRAVAELVDAATKTHGLAFAWQTPGSDEVDAVIEPAQADVLRDSLRESTVESRVGSYSGRLDGIRTKRRIFFLELDDPQGREISGAFEADLERDVMSLLNQRVIARIDVSRYRDRAGRAGKPVYRLVSLLPGEDVPLDA